MVNGGERNVTSEEVECQKKIEICKKEYREKMLKLKQTKSEIER